MEKNYVGMHACMYIYIHTYMYKSRPYAEIWQSRFIKGEDDLTRFPDEHILT